MYTVPFFFFEKIKAQNVNIVTWPICKELFLITEVLFHLFVSARLLLWKIHNCFICNILLDMVFEWH